MQATIERILALSGPMPDVQRHRHYLEGLELPALQARAAALQAEQPAAAIRPGWEISDRKFQSRFQHV
jgi:hypothetical protein